jgi:hypothetical protein
MRMAIASGVRTLEPVVFENNSSKPAYHQRQLRPLFWFVQSARYNTPNREMVQKSSAAEEGVVHSVSWRDQDA